MNGRCLSTGNEFEVTDRTFAGVSMRLSLIDSVTASVLGLPGAQD